MSHVRPTRPWAPMPISALVLFTWWVVAHNSGSGWVQFIGDTVFGVILVGILGPAVFLSRTRVRLSEAPTDGTAGLPLTVHLVASSRVRIRPLEPAGPETFVGPTDRRRGNDQLVLLPKYRGVHSHLTIEIGSAAPFGLQWWSRKATLHLPLSLHVSPRLGKPVRLPRSDLGGSGDQARPVPTHLGEPRGVRPYQPGDQRRQIHWPSTAHTARLMVREVEEPSAHPVTLKVTLPNDVDAAEREAEHALGTAVAVLDRGGSLLMVTSEVEGPVTGAVADRLEAGRRLARAVTVSRSTVIEARS